MSDSIFDTLRAAIQTEAPAALATVVECPPELADQVAVGAKILVRPDADAMGSLGNEDLDRVVVRDALGELSAGTSGMRHYGPNGEARQEEVGIFVESFAPPPQMLIFGAVDFTAALSRVAKILGYRVTVCDARPVFATTQRFPYADEVVVDWPHRLLEKVGPDLGERDAICVLTHDPKFDVPAVTAALKTDAGYLGAMGSRRTTEDRNRRLLEEGVPQADLDTVLAPIGLDLGARTPEETAISICAEIIALRSGRQAPSLRNSTGDIHT
ncbi:MAG: XdhC family protein [Acidimicrobiales bacterium]